MGREMTARTGSHRGSSTGPTRRRTPRSTRAAARHAHRRRRDRRRRCAVRRARARRRRARPHELVGVALPRRAAHLTVLGMNATSSPRNPQATARSCTTSTPIRACRSPTTSFDAAVCCVSVDYLVRPIEVFADVARVVRPGGPVRVHVLEPVLPDQGDPRLAVRRPTSEHGEIVAEYFRQAGGWDEPVVQRRTPEPAGYFGRPPLGRVGARVVRLANRMKAFQRGLLVAAIAAPGVGGGARAQQGPGPADEWRRLARAPGPRLPVSPAA